MIDQEGKKNLDMAFKATVLLSSFFPTRPLRRVAGDTGG